MIRAARIVALPVLATTLATLMPAMTQADAAVATTLSVSRHHVVQRDPVILSGTSSAKRITIQRSLDGAKYVTYTHATSKRGRYQVTVLPIAGKMNRYRIAGAAHMNVTSTACTPLSSHGSTSAWFNVRNAGRSVVATNWARAICSAAPGSTITLAAMLIWGGTPAADALIAALRAVATYRGVHVNVITESSQFPTNTAGTSTYATFAREFSFARIYSCAHGCTVTGISGSMHSKYMAISKTIFGGSAVIESSLNWSPQQFDRQNGSAIYFYNNRPLYAAYAAESTRIEGRVPATAVTEAVGWKDAGSGVAYAFDPSATMTDPITNELTTLSCRPGDYIAIINANVTRGRFVRQLNRLRAQGCAIRLITEQLYQPPAATYTARHMTTHDKFVLVHAGGANEVMTGSEDYRPASMVLAEEQLVKVQTPQVVNAYTTWFATEWKTAR